MANIGFCMNEVVNDERVISVRSAADTLDDGFLVIATALVTGERDVYTASQATAVTAADLAIVIGGDVYQDSLGNRVDIIDPTSINYPLGSTVRAYRPAKNMSYKIDKNAVTTATHAAFIVGNFLYPTANSYLWTAGTTVPASTTFALKIESLEAFSVGIESVDGAICRVTTAL